ncbi:DUF2190 family protein [Limimaricola sp.]|uniref:DUF2190 family protein n=1 Tax=Limimaricola sp. TaxID=2211665 RepID=UPI004058714D
MRNFIQPGNSITVPAPAAVFSGQGVIVGALFGVAATDAVTGEDVAISTMGVFELPKASGAIAVGAKVYWIAADKTVTTTATGNTLIGAAIEAAATGAATVRVRLNGTV